MRKFLSIVFILLLLSVSCITQGNGDPFTDEEKRSALYTLLTDMMNLTERNGEIGKEAFIDELPSSFAVYEDYSPLYQNLSQEYAESLSRIVSPIMEEAYSMISSSIPLFVVNADDLVIDSVEGMTDRIQNTLAVDIYSFLISRIEEEREKLNAAFSESYSIFTSLRDAYSNLESVGMSVSLPIPEPISIEKLAFIAEDVLFNRLGENERELRSRIPETEDSPYQVFWEETI